MNVRMPVQLFIDPPSHHFLGDRLFDSARTQYGGDDLMAPYRHLREWFEARGVDVHTADRLADDGPGGRTSVYVSLGMLDKFERLASMPGVIASAFFALECPIVEPSIYAALPRAARHFKRIYTWSDPETLKPFTGSPVSMHRFWWPQSFDRVHEALWARPDRRFLVMINANKLPRLFFRELYTERQRAVAHFARTGEIDLYGKGWDEPSYRVGITRVPYTFKRMYYAGRRAWDRIRPDPLLAAARRAWKGPTASKSDTLSRYTFAICFENAVLNGWITEKMFDCFFAGTIPVYWGAPDVLEYVPGEAFIDMRRFAGAEGDACTPACYDELRRYLRELPPREIAAYRDAARAFVGSPRFERFTKQAFTSRLAGIVHDDTGYDFQAETVRAGGGVPCEA